MTACTILALGACRSPQAGWEPDWMDQPPRLDVELDVQEKTWRTPRSVNLRWKLEDDAPLRYTMRNHVLIEKAPAKKDPVVAESQGSIALRPLGGGRSEVSLSTHMVTGKNRPTVRTYVMDESGMIEDPGPVTRTMLQLIFPVHETPLVPGEPVTLDVTSPSPGGAAETRGETTLGIIGFASVEGHPCAVVALNHEAHILARKTGSGELEDTGSVTQLHLLGYFDYKAGRYIAVAISEDSITVGKKREVKTHRDATYLLEGLVLP